MKNMRKYVFSGNKEWLKAVAQKYQDKVTVSSDYAYLCGLKDDTEAYIITLNDKNHPLDTAGKKTPFLFNEFRNVEPGALLSDVFVSYSDIECAMKGLEDRITLFDAAMQMMQAAEEGLFKVLYDGWYFGAGRDIDADKCKLYDKDDHLVAHLTIGTTDEVELTMYPEGKWVVFRNNGWYERTNTTLHDICQAIAFKGIKRDDREICRVLSDESGTLVFPRDTGDISREEILDPSWERWRY